MIRYRTITTSDPEYAEEKKLRDRVLRLPLGVELSETDLRGEDDQVHIVAVDDAGRLTGCVLIAFTEERAKVRQIAVDESCRGRGAGRELMMLAEQTIKARGVRTAMLHARVTAVGFFEKLGYKAVTGVFTEVTIPHIAMEKDLSS